MKKNGYFWIALFLMGLNSLISYIDGTSTLFGLSQEWSIFWQGLMELIFAINIAGAIISKSK